MNHGVQAMSSRQSKRLFPIILIAIGGLFSAFAGILGNVASNAIPREFEPYLWLAWPLLGVFTLLGIAFAVWLQLVDQRDRLHLNSINPTQTHCADLIRANRTLKTYTYSSRDIDRLVKKALMLLNAGAQFLPEILPDSSNRTISGEFGGERLRFRPGAVESLAQRRHEKSYLLSLIVDRDSLTWLSRLVPLAVQMNNKDAPLGVEISMPFSEARLSSKRKGQQTMTSVPLQDIAEAMAKHPAFVLLGDPGAGKTTTLQRIAFQAATDVLAGKHARVPLFVRLSLQGQRDPREFLSSEWERRTGTDFAIALAEGRVLILADGINEIPREERDKRLKAWRLFISDNLGANQIILTSRGVDYAQQLELPCVSIEPLDDARIAKYADLCGAFDLIELLDAPPAHLRILARNPFNLALLVMAHKSNHRTLDNRVGLLTWLVSELFRREERLAHPGWLPREAQVRALARLAYVMQCRGESTTISPREAHAALPKTVDVNEEQIAVRPTDLLRFARATNLLDPGTDPEVRFSHHLLQEFFAAIELSRQFGEGLDLSELWRCARTTEEMPTIALLAWEPLPPPPQTGWEVTTILACGMNENPGAFVEAIRPHNPVLAGRCLSESDRNFPADVSEHVQQDLLRDLCDVGMHIRTRLQAGRMLGVLGDPRFPTLMINNLMMILPRMVAVPGGTYAIGSTEDDTEAFEDEKPRHTVELRPFMVGRWSVTNAEYRCFIEAGGYLNRRWWKTQEAQNWLDGNVLCGEEEQAYCLWDLVRINIDLKQRLDDVGNYLLDDDEAYDYLTSPRGEKLRNELRDKLSTKSRSVPAYWTDGRYNNPSFPVVGVTWFEAQAYCSWLSSVSGYEFRLLSEMEWEVAARGNDARLYPWGNKWDNQKANVIEGQVLGPTPVGAYAVAGGVSPFGIEDQCGNVWDWTSSPYLEYQHKSNGQESIIMTCRKAARGGSWHSLRKYARTACREGFMPFTFGCITGFRLACDGLVEELRSLPCHRQENP